MSDEIRNCDFRFKCPKAWDALEKTPIVTQRYCSECQTIVLHCRTAAELEWAIVRNLCVAVEVVTSKEPAEKQLHVDTDISLSIGMAVVGYIPKEP